MNEPAIHVDSLRKAYATLVAVDSLTFDVGRGEIFGLLGPNGAGKTTTIRMLMDILTPDSGTVRVLGQPPREVRHQVGYLPEERGLYQSLRVTDCLVYLAQLKGLPKAAAQQRAAQLLERVELTEWGRRKVDELSRGMQQKVQLLASVIHDPELVVLDEPFQGLDPVNAEMVRGLIRDLRAEGKTIVLSAHEMSLVEMLCERIVLIHQGHAVLNGPLAEIKRQFAPNAIEISPPVTVTDLPGVTQVETLDGRQRLTLAPGVEPREVLRLLIERGVPVDRFERATASLDEVFVAVVTGRNNHGSQ